MSVISVLATTVVAMGMIKPVPADNYYSWYSEEIAENIMEAITSNEYYSHLDFNGDGILSVVDAVAVRKRYIYNVLSGNTMHFDESNIMEIVAENFKSEEYDEYFYYEIDFINGECCRAYELDLSETTYFHVYMEMNETTADFNVLLRPAEESYQVY